LGKAEVGRSRATVVHTGTRRDGLSGLRTPWSFLPSATCRCTDQYRVFLLILDRLFFRFLSFLLITPSIASPVKPCTSNAPSRSTWDPNRPAAMGKVVNVPRSSAGLPPLRPKLGPTPGASTSPVLSLPPPSSSTLPRSFRGNKEASSSPSDWCRTRSGSARSFRHSSTR
jgi:hypothetical protein